jgi:hypothetical protein
MQSIAKFWRKRDGASHKGSIDIQNYPVEDSQPGLSQWPNHVPHDVGLKVNANRGNEALTHVLFPCHEPDDAVQEKQLA